MKTAFSVRNLNKCKSCKSDNLHSGWFDGEDLAVNNPIDSPSTDPNVRWTTFCNECGSEVK